MKCTNCGAETKGNFCEYCGSELPKENQAINEPNNHCQTSNPDSCEHGQCSTTCPKCGSNNINFNREHLSTVTKSKSKAKWVGTKRKGVSTSKTSYKTIAVCQNCGYDWDPNTDSSKKNNSKTWLWVLGWIFIFPLPLTILLLRKKNLKPAIKYSIIIVAWGIYLLIGIQGNNTTETMPPLDNSSKAEITQSSQIALNPNNTTKSETIETTPPKNILTNNTSDNSSDTEFSTEENKPNFSFDLVAGEAGAYGQLITLNKDTEFQLSFYAYYVPAGTYVVTNKREYPDQITICDTGINVTEAGWEEPLAKYAKRIDANGSITITLEENQYVKIVDPSILEFVMQ